ncbi:MAG TPA: TonB-dependent receptor [Saprospiraceae bacterium]|nr:TonB-dependent receptor [Saprospiraceae bacterium]
MNYKTYLLFKILIFITLPFILNAQKQISGIIQSEKSGKMVPYAVIKAGDQMMVADGSGHFSGILPDKTDEISVECLGYETKSFAVSEFKDLQAMVIILHPDPVVFGQILISESPGYKVSHSQVVFDRSKMVVQPLDAGDLIRGVPGFGVMKRGAYALEPVFRGFNQEQINILFDGLVQYNHACPNRMDPATTHIIPEEIGKVEIVRGPFSVRYGPVMGAVLNFQTENLGKCENGWNGSVETAYETNSQGKSGRAYLGYKGNKFDIYFNGAIKDYENYKSGAGDTISSSFNKKDYGVKLSYNPTSNQRIQLVWKQAFLKDAKYAGLPMDARSDDSDMASISYRIDQLSKRILSLEAGIFGNQMDHIMDNFDRPNFAMVEAVSTVFADTYGGKVELSVVPAKNTLSFIGFDHRSLFRDGARDRHVKKNMMTGADLPVPVDFVDKIWQKSQLQSSGIFLENKYFPTSQLTFNLGLRADRVTAQINDPAEDFAALYTLEDKSEFNFSGNLSVSYQANKNTVFQFGLGRGVRSATIDERYVNHFAVGKDPYELVGNPDLKPEVNYQAELSLQKKWQHFGLEANVFYSMLQNLITAAVDATLPRKYSPWMEPKFAKRFVNVDEAFKTGFELNAFAEVTSDLSLNWNYMYTYAQNVTWDEPVSRIPPMETGLLIKYEKPVWWASVQGRYVFEQNRTAVSFGEIPSEDFLLIHLRAGVKPFKGLFIGLALENMFNEDYVEFLNWSYDASVGQGVIAEPGRNLSIFLKYSF